MEATKPKEVVVLEKKISAIRLTASSIVITDDESMLSAAEIRKNIKDYAKQVKEEKEKATKPLNEVIKTVKSWFVTIETDCDDAISDIEGKMRIYQNKVDEAKRKIELEAAKKKAEADAKLKSGEITEIQAAKVIEKAEAKVEKAPEVITKSSDFHTRVNRKVRFAEVSSLSMTQLFNLAQGGYITWDEVKARRDVLNGSILPGTEIYEEKSFV